MKKVLLVITLGIGLFTVAQANTLEKIKSTGTAMARNPYNIGNCLPNQ